MSKKVKLNNGIELEISDRKSNSSGYTGAALSINWTLDVERPFIAACGNPRDPEIMDQLAAQKRTAWHGGNYADAREAAYVVQLFKINPVETELAVRSGDIEFPADLYNLPVFVTREEAVAFLKEKLASVADSKQTRSSKKTRTVKITLNNEEARKVFWTRQDKTDYNAMTAKYGKACVDNDLMKLTWNEFDLRYGMDA